MKNLMQSFAVLFGKDPVKADQSEMTKKTIAEHKRKTELRGAELSQHIKAERHKKFHSPQKWRRKRWISIIVVNLLFVLSYRLDLQLVEGALTASRFVGFHMADLNSALQVTLAFKQILINLVIGVVTVFIVWWLLGGRTFCSWICPYHILSEWAELIHLKLSPKFSWIKHHDFDRRARFILWLVFAVLAYVTGYTVYETISPTGILSRALVYGPSVAALWVLALLVFEVFYSRRFWCRYACPIGLTYGLVGATAPLKIKHDLRKCFNDGACRKVCLVPHVLHSTKKGAAVKLNTELGADCTRCGRCIDVCPTGALSFKFKVGK
jgi:ferredoxin-type protein NapH